MTPEEILAAAERSRAARLATAKEIPGTVLRFDYGYREDDGVLVVVTHLEDGRPRTFEFIPGRKEICQEQLLDFSLASSLSARYLRPSRAPA
jgi:hypothetical protein